MLILLSGTFIIIHSLTAKNSASILILVFERKSAFGELGNGMVSPGMTTPFSSTISKVALKYCFVTFSTIISSFSDERKNPLYLSLWPFSLVNTVPFSSFACDSLSSLPL